MLIIYILTQETHVFVSGEQLYDPLVIKDMEDSV
jgi:hypothetical protein